MSDPSIETIRSEADAVKTLTPVEIWLRKIKASERLHEKWCDEASEAQKMYEQDENKAGSFNIFHANVEVQATALYNSTPVPDVRRRYGDKDPVARLVSEVVERSLSYAVDQYDFDCPMKASVKQALVPGRGTVRVVYEPEIGMETDPTTGQQYEAVKSRHVRCRIVPWNGWGHGPGRTWEEVPFVYFNHWLSEDEVKAILQSEHAILPQTNDMDPAQFRIEKLGFGDKKNEDHDKPDTGVFKTTLVREVWDKASRQIIFIADDDTDTPLAVKPDELDMWGFFPVPRPLTFKSRIDSLVPMVPLSLYRHLVRELDRINERIFKILSALRVRGVVDAKIYSAAQEMKVLDDGEYAVADTAEMRSLLTSGGLKLDDFVSHWPIEPLILALRELQIQREQTKALIYEATGISDIIRGSVDPREKLGQSQIKAQAGSQRLEEARGEVARYARDLYRLMADIICSQYSDQEISQITGLPQTQEDQQAWPEAMKVLREDRLRSYRIDIETDSTIRADMGRTQEVMNNFLQMTAQFGQTALQIGQAAPPLAPAIVATYAAATRHLPLGKAFEDALEQLDQMAPNLMQMQQENAEQQKNYERENRDAQFAQDRKLKKMEVNGKFKLEEYKARIGANVQQGDDDMKREEMDRDEAGENKAAARDQMNKDADREDKREERQEAMNDPA